MRSVRVLEPKRSCLFSISSLAPRNKAYFSECDVCILRTRSDMGVARMWGLSQLDKVRLEREQAAPSVGNA